MPVVLPSFTGPNAPNGMLLIAPNTPQQLDLSAFLDVQDGDGMDPYDPAFTEKVISHSLLKEGGVLALENLQAKELIFPLRLHAANPSALATLIQQINQLVTTPGVRASWQDAGMSQPTYFDLISGQFDIAYRFREQQQAWCSGKLRLFSQPLGHAGGPRVLAAASGPGPLLMISPYRAGVNILGASNGGYGGQQQPSGGIFYPTAPSLAGDGPALLQMSWLTAPGTVQGSATAVSLLPDAAYQPWTNLLNAGNAYGASVPGGTVYTSNVSLNAFVEFAPLLTPPPLSWEGNHRVLVFARASQSYAILAAVPNTLVNNPAVASVAPNRTFDLYDLGCFTLRASEAVADFFAIRASVAGAVDIAAAIMLPDSHTWFMNTPNFAGGNGAMIDDTVRDQFFLPNTYTAAPSPTGVTGLRITQYSRGLPPRPDPHDGPPILAVLGTIPSPYPQWLMSAQVNVLERTRYVLN